MKLNLLFFGVLTEATGLTNLCVERFSKNTLEALNHQLLQDFPQIKLHTYKIAVNQKMVKPDHLLQEGDEVAFLPPFAGG
jgi:molybdopterin converting factor small subunit